MESDGSVEGARLWRDYVQRTSKLNVNELGQVFTPENVVKKMLALRKNRGSVLEPSAGNGAFLSLLEDSAVGIEIDNSLIEDKRVLSEDFFSYSLVNKFDTIIGNPPYVRYQDIYEQTKRLLPMEWFDARSNLYLFFIAKCTEHLNQGGELIFITPRDFLKATSARKLNRYLYEKGTITHYYEMGDQIIFNGAKPNCAIWRWVKGLYDRSTFTGGTFCFRDGQIWFGSPTSGKLDDYFEVKVGAVSGADDVFVNTQRGCTDMVCSATARTGKTRRVIYNRKDPSLNSHKARLMCRRIRRFDETNWWQWGRKFCLRNGQRIYVNVKTRNKQPFYTHTASAYDGSVLALFPKQEIDMERTVVKLNTIDWYKLDFVCDGRFLFTQKSLSVAPIEL